MPQLVRIIKIKPTVERILKEFPDTRDNDRLLLLKVWAEQVPELRNNFSFVDFSKIYLSGKLVDTESVRRSRQKIQEQQPQLKGNFHHKRKESEQEMRTNIKTV